MKLTNLPPNPAQKILVFGPPKSGKTLLVGLLAHWFKLNWIDGEKGGATLLHNLTPEEKENVNILQLADTKEYPVMCQTVIKVLTGAKSRACDNHGLVFCPVCAKDLKATWVDFETLKQPLSEILVIDSWTQMDISIMNQRMRQKFGDKGAPDDYKSDWDDYRYRLNFHLTAGNYIQALPCHVVVITHTDSIAAPDKSTKLYPVAGSDNSTLTFPKFFDTVIYVEVENKQHKAGSSTTYSLTALSGSRTNIGIEKLPTIDRVINGQAVKIPNLAAIFKPELAQVKPAIQGVKA